MIPLRRQDYLLELLSRKTVMSISELTELLSVSHMTVRRDIAQLEAQGSVLSVSGGVRLAANFRQEPPWQEKVAINMQQKSAIARHATASVHDGMSVYLDAGTTAYEMARLLTGHNRLSVITNNFHITALLTQYPHIDLFHAGGRVNHENYSSVGPSVVDYLRHVNVDIAFVSSSSWHLERGVTTPDESKLLVKQQLLKIASKSVLIADSAKYGRVGMFHACALGDFDQIITDDGLADDACFAIRDRDIELQTVATSPLRSAKEHQEIK